MTLRRLVLLLVYARAVSQLDSVSKCKQDIRSRVTIADIMVVRYTMVTSERLETVLQLWSDVLARGLPGDWVETGTFKGGTSLLAAKVARAAYQSPICPHKINRTIWLADSFKGLPSPTQADIVMDAKVVQEIETQKVVREGGGKRMDRPGSYGGYGGVQEVKNMFAREGFLNTPTINGVMIQFLQGWFRETLPLAPIDRIAILRLDGDMYSSTMTALKALYPKVEPSGFLVIDDYGWWMQCKHAVDTYFRSEQGWMPSFMSDGITGRWMQKPEWLPCQLVREEHQARD